MSSTISKKAEAKPVSHERLAITMPNGQKFTVHHNPRLSHSKNLENAADLIDFQIKQLQDRVALMRKAAEDFKETQ